MKNKENGITLIALVITIVIIFIIVGISIGALAGKNGMLTKAEEAKMHNEFSTVEDTLLVKVNETYIDNQVNVFGDNKSVIMRLYDTGFITYMYELELDRLGLSELTLGKGNYREGDYYSLRDEKLTYVDKNQKVYEIRDFTGIGQVPRDIKYTYENKVKEIDLDINGEGKGEYTLSNYLIRDPEEDNLEDELFDPTKDDIYYEISMEDIEKSALDVSIDGIKLNNTPFKGIIKGYDRNTHKKEIKVKQQDGKQMSEEILKLKLKIKDAKKEVEDITITVRNNILKDHSGNGYNATLKDGTKIVKDEEGKYALEFDGVKNYVQIPTIKRKEKFSDGFKVDIEMKADDKSGDSVMLTLGNGKNGVNNGKELIILQLTGENKIKFETSINDASAWINSTTNTSNNVGRKIKVRGNLQRNGGISSSKIWLDINGKKTESKDKGYLVKTHDTDRTENYIGKSYWDEGQFFKGKIYSVKITSDNGSTILDYDLNR